MRNCTVSMLTRNSSWPTCQHLEQCYIRYRGHIARMLSDRGQQALIRDIARLTAADCPVYQTHAACGDGQPAAAAACCLDCYCNPWRWTGRRARAGGRGRASNSARGVTNSDTMTYPHQPTQCGYLAGHTQTFWQACRASDQVGVRQSTGVRRGVTNVTRLRHHVQTCQCPPQWWRHSVEVGLVIPLARSAAGRSYGPGGDKTDYRERWSDAPCTPGLLL
eukprot:364051-Chlamydomonas_euryale.AAC.5